MDSRSTQTAEAVETAITAAGLTHLGVAEASGIPRTTLLRKLAGHSSFTIDELERLAPVIGVRFSDLLPSEEVA